MSTRASLETCRFIKTVILEMVSKVFVVVAFCLGTSSEAFVPNKSFSRWKQTHTGNYMPVHGTSLHSNPIIRLFPSTDDSTKAISVSNNKVIDFYEAWNCRDIDAAAECFVEDAFYDDKNFADPLVGKEEIRAHFRRCADAFPESFKFAVDDMAVDADQMKIGVKWHVEDEGKELPFTQGSSFYTLDRDSGLVTSGYDFVEGVIKPGDASLTVLSIASKIINEPVRIFPLLSWIAYVYIVFFSDGILPGANALALERRTWEEVLNLSINFFFVSPTLNLPFSPVVHPCLEGVFNLLLSWAALFAGFLSDERSDKKNVIPMLPTVVGMQFLTSAFLLPYLVSRESEERGRENPVLKQDLSSVGNFFENKFVGPFLGGVGGVSIFWGLFERPEFGGFADRYSSFIDLLSIDRVGSSFIVDLLIFGLFQFWLIDDDLKRRGVENCDLIPLRVFAKFVPFFGLAFYLAARPDYKDEYSPVTGENV